MSFKANVLVTDDHTLFRKGTMKLLETFEEVNKIYEAENGKVALEKLNENAIDLVLLDLEMPVMDGWETARRIVQNHPDTYLIMVSMHDSLKIIADLIEIGVHSYLLKNAEPEEMHLAICSVIDSHFYYNQLVSNALRKKVEASTAHLSKKTDLTNREIEIVRLICQEMTMKEISDALFISDQTVQTHRKNLMKKIDARNSVSIVRFALQNGIVSL